MLFNRSSSLRNQAVRLACAALLSAGAASSQAVTVTPHGATAMPGGNATISFDLDFGDTPVLISSFDYHVSFDSSLLSFVGSSASYQGVPTDVDALFNSAGTYITAWSTDPFTPVVAFNALWFAMDGNLDPLPPLSLSGKMTLNYQLALAPSFPEFSSSNVHFLLSASDGNLDALPNLETDAVVSAVPEAQSWVLMLAGAGVLAAYTRRKAG